MWRLSTFEEGGQYGYVGTLKYREVLVAINSWKRQTGVKGHIPFGGSGPCQLIASFIASMLGNTCSAPLVSTMILWALLVHWYHEMVGIVETQ